MKTYKRLSAAKKAANGLPFIRVGRGKNEIFLVSEDEDLVAFGLTEVSLISPEGQVGGHITMKHLDRIGNGNWATPGGHGYYADCFKADGMNQADWERSMGMSGYRGSPAEKADRARGIKVGGQCYWLVEPENMVATIAAIEMDEDGDPWFHLTFACDHKDVRAMYEEIAPL